MQYKRYPEVAERVSVMKLWREMYYRTGGRMISRSDLKRRKVQVKAGLIADKYRDNKGIDMVICKVVCYR